MESLWNNPNTEDLWFSLKRYYAVNWSFYEMLPHLHNEMEVMYVVFGECEITCYDRAGRPHTRKMKTGEYVIIDAFVPHTLYVPRASSCRILNLEITLSKSTGPFRIGDLGKLDSAASSFIRGKRLFCFLQDKNNELLSIITGMQSHSLPESTSSRPGELALDLYFSQFLVTAASHASSGDSDSRGNRYVMGARKFMEDNLENPIAVSDIAGALGISSAYLQRIYRDACGETLIETLNRMRMEKACVLLLQSKLPVIEVAISVGFNSRQHFSHTFTKYFGYSPAIYRSMKGYGEVYEGFQDTASHKIVRP